MLSECLNSCCILYAFPFWVPPSFSCPVSAAACCLLVYLTLIANAHRDLANDELDWGKITRCFPRHRYIYSHTNTAHVILENVVCLPAWGCRVNSELSSLNPWVCSVINAPHTVDLPTEHAVGHFLSYRICFSFLSTNKMSIQMQLLSISIRDFKHSA